MADPIRDDTEVCGGAITIGAMFVRLRWFVLGALSTLWLMAYLATQVKRARERITPTSLARSSRRSFASLLERTADMVEPKSH